MNNFNYIQIILNKHQFKRDSVTLMWQFADIFLSMVHNNIHNIYFMIQILDWIFNYISSCQILLDVEKSLRWETRLS